MTPNQFPINVFLCLTPKTSAWTVPRTAFSLSIPSMCSGKLLWPHSLSTRRSAFHMSDTGMGSRRGKQDKCSACFLSSFLPPEHCHTPFISIPWHIAIRSVHQEQSMTVKAEMILECWNNHFLIESRYYMFVNKKAKITIFNAIHLYGLVVNDCERKRWWNAKLSFWRCLSLPFFQI